MSEAREVLHVDFREDSLADGRTGGEIRAGFDGEGAFFANNPFGVPAKDYLRFENLQGIDLRRDSFSLVLWCRTLYGGSTEWLYQARESKPGIGIRADEARGGGVLAATMETVGGTSGIAAVMHPQRAHFAAGLVDADGRRYELDGIWQPEDGRWHQLALLFDREGLCRIYVDDVLRGETDISAAAGQAVGGNTLTIGADAAGNYGIGAAYIQKVRLYRGILEEAEVLEAFQTQRLRGLIYEITQRMEQLGREYTEEMKVPLRAAVAEAERGGAETYERLAAAYETFLAAPQDQAVFTAALIGDPHISQPGDASSQATEVLIADTLSSGIKADVLLSVGDNGHDSSYEIVGNAFRTYAELTEKYAPDWQFVSCHGNHDTMYNDEHRNYLAGTRAYWEGMRRFLFGEYRKESLVVDELYRDVCEKYLGEKADHGGYSYGVTVRGTHILVLNTDYFDQTGNARAVWSLEGNLLDPIRHALLFYEGTFQWIEHMLETYSRDSRPTFVLCHFPFIDTTPLSTYHEINIEDHSIGRQDPRIRELLSRYNVFYICGHLHSGLGLSVPVQVVSGERSFPEISISSMYRVARAYRDIPAGWHLFLYEDEIVLRARDYGSHQWLTAYDEVIPLRKESGGRLMERR